MHTYYNIYIVFQTPKTLAMQPHNSFYLMNPRPKTPRSGPDANESCTANPGISYSLQAWSSSSCRTSFLCDVRRWRSQVAGLWIPLSPRVSPGRKTGVHRWPKASGKLGSTLRGDPASRLEPRPKSGHEPAYPSSVPPLQVVRDNIRMNHNQGHMHSYMNIQSPYQLSNLPTNVENSSPGLFHGLV